MIAHLLDSLSSSDAQWYIVWDWMQAVMGLLRDWTPVF